MLSHITRFLPLVNKYLTGCLFRQIRLHWRYIITFFVIVFLLNSTLLGLLRHAHLVFVAHGWLPGPGCTACSSCYIKPGDTFVPAFLSEQFMHYETTHTHSLADSSHSQDDVGLLSRLQATRNESHRTKVQHRSFCPLPNPLYGVQTGSFCTRPQYTFAQLSSYFPHLRQGGFWTPPNCIPRSRIAIIIPYRNRLRHLLVLLHRLHTLLQNQLLEYRIIIAEQSSISGAHPEKLPFNRGMIKNIGFHFAINDPNLPPPDCVYFHDVDLIPEDPRNTYLCPPAFGQVLHRALLLSVWNYKLKEENISIARAPLKYSRYSVLSHSKENRNPLRFQLVVNARYRYKREGLNSLKYKLLSIKRSNLATWITVDIDEDTVMSTVPQMTNTTRSQREAVYNEYKAMVDSGGRITFSGQSNLPKFLDFCWF